MIIMGIRVFLVSALSMVEIIFMLIIIVVRKTILSNIISLTLFAVRIFGFLFL